MASLEPYHRLLPYSYAPGLFPALACLHARPDCARRLLVHTQAREGEGLSKLVKGCEALGLRVEVADRALRRISGKENCFAALVFEKPCDMLSGIENHFVLYQPSDRGNLGSIMRTLVGFGLRDLAIIRPAVDPYDPQVVRASMGAMFHLRIVQCEDFAAYRAQYPGHTLHPFMLDASAPLEQAARDASAPYALIFGNEASGLPPDFAALGRAVRIPHSEAIDSLNLAAAVSIGTYVFTRTGGDLHDG